ncbi:MAG TPA: gfo/Idh/MocA family oxidoreductase, partial [Legionellaceae bacterium]|nr:gfo/Idh/MocA family oxidoreductase [Legionellaceae bacterium]
IDIANARIKFKNQCVANMMASRISAQIERKTRIFQPESYISVDYHAKKLAVFSSDRQVTQDIITTSTDALKDEIQAFLQCIRQDSTPIVTGAHGRDALATAIQISQLIETNVAHHAIV